MPLGCGAVVETQHLVQMEGRNVPDIISFPFYRERQLKIRATLGNLSGDFRAALMSPPQDTTSCQNDGRKEVKDAPFKDYPPLDNAV